MPYNPETEQFYQAPGTVVDSTPDGDTVQEGFDDRLTPALAGIYADFNLLKADGMISVGIPATTTARGIGRVATAADMVAGATITGGPAFLDASTFKVSATPTANVIPKADANGLLADGWMLRAAPPGFSGFYAGSTAPEGWLEENGAAISRTTYSNLFAAIGTTYGAGDGSTTFNLPDSRGYVKRVWDHDRGIDSGRALGSTQDDQNLAHTHGTAVNSGSMLGSGGTTPYAATYVASGSTGSSGGDEARMKNIAFMGIIKY